MPARAAAALLSASRRSFRLAAMRCQLILAELPAEGYRAAAAFFELSERRSRCHFAIAAALLLP